MLTMSTSCPKILVAAAAIQVVEVDPAVILILTPAANITALIFGLALLPGIKRRHKLCWIEKIQQAIGTRTE